MRLGRCTAQGENFLSFDQAVRPPGRLVYRRYTGRRLPQGLQLGTQPLDGPAYRVEDQFGSPLQRRRRRQ